MYHRQKKNERISYLNCIIGVHDDGQEERQDDVDEEGDEGVEVDPGEPPDDGVLGGSRGEGGVHVIPVDEGEEALHGG